MSEEIAEQLAELLAERESNRIRFKALSAAMRDLGTMFFTLRELLIDKQLVLPEEYNHQLAYQMRRVGAMEEEIAQEARDSGSSLEELLEAAIAHARKHRQWIQEENL